MRPSPGVFGKEDFPRGTRGAQGTKRSSFLPRVPRGNFSRLCLFRSSDGAALQIQTRIDGVLVGDREVVERVNGSLNVRGFRQFECIEAATSHEEQLIALDLADGAQFTGELVSLAQQ